MPGAEEQLLVARLQLDVSQLTQSAAAAKANLERLDAGFKATAATAKSMGVSLGAVNAALAENAAAISAYSAGVARFYTLQDEAAAKSAAAAQAATAASAEAYQARATLFAQAEARRVEAAQASASAIVRLQEQEAAAATAAMNQRLAAMERLAAAEAKRDAAQTRYLNNQAAARQRYRDAIPGVVRGPGRLDSLDATSAMNARLMEQQANAATRMTARIQRLGSVAQTAASGGITFLTRSFLLTAGAGVLLERQFLAISDAQAALARTLDNEAAPAIAKLNEQIIQLSETVPLPTTELYRIAEIAGTLGIAAGDIGQFTKVVAQLAATTDLTADEAAKDFGKLLNIFHLGVGEADALGSALVKLSVSQASSDQAILTATERFASLATNMGLVPPQILAIASAATALGQEPEAVGGSLQRIFGIFNKLLGEEGKKPSQKLLDFAKVSGLTVKQLRQQWATNPMEGFFKFLEGFGNLTAQQQAQLFGPGELFPSFVRGAQTLQNLSDQLPLLRQGLIGAGDAYKEALAGNSTLAAQAAVRFDTLKNNLILLGNAFKQVGFRFGASFGGEANDAIKQITQAVLDAIPAVEEFGRKVGRFLADINWREVSQVAMRFFNVIVTGAEAAINVLKAIPAPILEAIALYKTLNFLSGGAVGTIVGGAVGGIAGALATALGRIITTGRLGAAFVQPVFVTNQGFGPFLGGAGKWGLLFTALSGIAAALPLLAVALVKIDQILKPPKSPGTAEGFNETFNAPWNFIGKLLGQQPVVTPQSAGFGHGSDVGLLANVADKWKAALTDEQQAAKELQFAANILGDSGILIEKAARSFLESLRPRHREGEVGKSRQSAEFRFLERVDPSKTDKIGAALEDLVRHYKTEGIGTKEHPREWIQKGFKGIFPDIAAALRRAMKSGDTGGVNTIIENLKNLKELGIHLPPGLRRLIRQAEKGSQTAHDDAVKARREAERMADRLKAWKTALTDPQQSELERSRANGISGPGSNEGLIRPSAILKGSQVIDKRLQNVSKTIDGRLEDVRAAIARKKLSTTVKPMWKASVRAPSVRVNPIVRVTIGARTITRYVRGVTSYGPGIVLMQTGTGAAYYSGGGGP